jgi:hypothetical protein
MARATVESRAATAAMRVTTVRFGHDLWQLLEAEAALVGTSVSPYIREASLARAAAAAAARGENTFELLACAGSPAPPDKARQARDRAARERDDARALQAESKQARAEATKRADRAGRPARRTPDSARNT